MSFSPSHHRKFPALEPPPTPRPSAATPRKAKFHASTPHQPEEEIPLLAATSVPTHNQLPVHTASELDEDHPGGATGGSPHHWPRQRNDSEGHSSVRSSRSSLKSTGSKRRRQLPKLFDLGGGVSYDSDVESGYHGEITFHESSTEGVTLQDSATQTEPNVRTSSTAQTDTSHSGSVGGSGESVGSSDNVVQAIQAADQAMQALIANTGTNDGDWYASPRSDTSPGQSVRVVVNGDMLMNGDGRLTDSAKQALKKSPVSDRRWQKESHAPTAHSTPVHSINGHLSMVPMNGHEETHSTLDGMDYLSNANQSASGDEAEERLHRDYEIVEQHLTQTIQVLRPHTSLSSVTRTGDDAGDAQSWDSGSTEPELPLNWAGGTHEISTQTLRTRKTQTPEESSTQTPQGSGRQLPMPPITAMEEEEEGSDVEEENVSPRVAPHGASLLAPTHTPGQANSDGSLSDYRTNSTLMKTLHPPGTASLRSSQPRATDTLPLEATREIEQQPEYLKEYQRYIESFDGTRSGPFLPHPSPRELHQGSPHVTPVSLLVPQRQDMLHLSPSALRDNTDGSGSNPSPRHISSGQGSSSAHPSPRHHLSSGHGSMMPSGEQTSPGDSSKESSPLRGSPSRLDHHPSQSDMSTSPTQDRGRSRQVVPNTNAARNSNLHKTMTDMGQQTLKDTTTQTPIKVRLLGSNSKELAALRRSISLGDTFVIESDDISGPYPQTIAPWNIIGPHDLELVTGRDFSTQTFGQLYQAHQSHIETQTEEEVSGVEAMVEELVMPDMAAPALETAPQMDVDTVPVKEPRHKKKSSKKSHRNHGPSDSLQGLSRCDMLRFMLSQVRDLKRQVAGQTLDEDGHKIGDSAMDSGIEDSDKYAQRRMDLLHRSSHPNHGKYRSPQRSDSFYHDRVAEREDSPRRAYTPPMRRSPERPLYRDYARRRLPDIPIDDIPPHGAHPNDYYGSYPEQAWGAPYGPVAPHTIQPVPIAQGPPLMAAPPVMPAAPILLAPSGQQGTMTVAPPATGNPLIYVPANSVPGTQQPYIVLRSPPVYEQVSDSSSAQERTKKSKSKSKSKGDTWADAKREAKQMRRLTDKMSKISYWGMTCIIDGSS